jgi:hypothetical protein
MKRELVAEILALPVAERMRLVEAIWDSISSVPDALPLTHGKWMSLIAGSRSSRLTRTLAHR